MIEDRQTSRNSFSAPALLSVGLVTLPFLLIAAAVFEEVVLHTGILSSIYRRLGIFAPLDRLCDTIVELLTG